LKRAAQRSFANGVSGTGLSPTAWKKRENAFSFTRLQTRNSDGHMVPLGTVLRGSDTTGPESAMRYNAFRSADLNGGPAPGYSSGQAQRAITRILAETLPKGMAFEWTELTFQQEIAGNTAILVFPICVLLVFLVLAAKYESLFLPLAIILIVPMCLLLAIAGVWLSGGDSNIFTQIGFFVLAGLACKNAVLIVEFAHEIERQGEGTVAAAIKAARLRLRPILMTSFAFMMGVVPLVPTSGAGAEMRSCHGRRGVLRHVLVGGAGFDLQPPRPERVASSPTAHRASCERLAGPAFRWRQKSHEGPVSGTRALS
jgi:multidrug efflux pump subunit AcrB